MQGLVLAILVQCDTKTDLIINVKNAYILSVQ